MEQISQLLPGKWADRLDWHIWRTVLVEWHRRRFSKGIPISFVECSHPWRPLASNRRRDARFSSIECSAYIMYLDECLGLVWLIIVTCPSVPIFPACDLMGCVATHRKKWLYSTPSKPWKCACVPLPSIPSWLHVILAPLFCDESWH